MKNTKQHKEYWENRKINWEEDYLKGVINHPHRQMIINALSKMQFKSVLEVGMGAGANLVRIKHQWPSVEVGGTDINLDAVKTASKYLPDAKYLDTGDPRDIYMSDKSIDVVMSDACLIYFDPRNIKKALREMKRVSRNGILLCEFHHESLYKRWKLRLDTGYNAYNYIKLLDELDFFDIQVTKIPKEVWPDTVWEEFGHIITAQHI